MVKTLAVVARVDCHSDGCVIGSCSVAAGPDEWDFYEKFASTTPASTVFHRIATWVARIEREEQPADWWYQDELSLEGAPGPFDG